jgi:hypothetical protein
VILLNIFNKVDKRREAGIVLPDGRMALLARRESSFCVLLHETIAKNRNEGFKERFNGKKSWDDERNAIEVAVWIERALAASVVGDQRCVPVFRW